MTNCEKSAHDSLDAARREVPGADYILVFSCGDQCYVGRPEELDTFLAASRNDLQCEFIGIAALTELGEGQVDVKCLLPMGICSGSNDPEMQRRHVIIREAVRCAARLVPTTEYRN